MEKVLRLSLTTAAALLLGGIFASPASAQYIGSTSPQTVQQKILSASTTAIVSPNSSPFPCTPTPGVPCAIPNLGQTTHSLTYTAPSCTGLVLRLEASNDGVNFFSISQDATDNAPNPVGGITGVGGVTAVGYYPVIRVNLVSVFGGGCVVTAFYSGTSTVSPTPTQVNQQASLYRFPVTVNTVTSAAFTTIEIPTPFGSSAGSIWLQCSAACASGGAVNVFASPSDTGIASVQIIGPAVGTVSTLQRFDVPAISTNRVFVGLTPTGASANTWAIYYNFIPPGGGSLIANSGNAGAAGQSPTGVLTCNNFSAINQTANLLYVAGGAGKQTYICSINLVSAGADNIAVVEGTGATCGTATAGIFGGATAATGWNLGANGVVTHGSGFGMIGKTAIAGDSVCILVSAATQVSGGFTWTQF